MAQLETITPEEARMRLLIAFHNSGDGMFLEALERPFLNPIEQRDNKGRRKPHTLLVVAAIMVAIAGISAFVFGFHIWGA